MKRCLLCIFSLLFLASVIQAQTTGKIAGIVTDKKTGDQLVGVNVYIEDSNLGATTDGHHNTKAKE